LFIGGVAQLGEHLLCKQGVGSSILLASTILIRRSYMPPKETPTSPAAFIVMAVFYLLFFGALVTYSVIMLVTWWRAMKAHERIADKLAEIADKLPLK
jgi:hypothetical protein